MKVLVTSSRTWDDAGYVWRVLDELLHKHGGLVLVHGDCPTGGDRHADDWARQRQSEGHSVVVDRYAANWGRYGRAAGLRRNAEMVADLAPSFGRVEVHGFLRDQSKGTSHCLKLARRAGLPVVVHRWEDRAPLGLRGALL